MNKQKEIIIGIVSLAILLGVIYFFVTRGDGDTVLDAEADAALKAETDKLNPFNQEESTNPFEESTNPYENIKTNPFE
ncbi:MAG: hypothetical protein Q7R67_02290 [bacterium]|nr:hypothetical protein [bacterium]